MSKLTPIQKSAQNEQCTFRLSVCNHKPETTVLCHDTRWISHSPRRNDTRAAYGCSECHAFMDSNKLGAHEAGYEWGRAIAETHVRLIEKGLLKFEGVEAKPTKILPRR